MNAAHAAQHHAVHGRARHAAGYLLVRVPRAAHVAASRQMPVVVAAQWPSINGRRVDIPVTSAVAQAHQLHVNLALSARQLAPQNVLHPALPLQRHRHVAHGNRHVNSAQRDICPSPHIQTWIPNWPMNVGVRKYVRNTNRDAGARCPGTPLGV